MPASYHIAQELQKYNIPDYRPRQEQFQKAIKKVRAVQRMRRNRGFAFSQTEDGGKQDQVRCCVALRCGARYVPRSHPFHPSDSKPSIRLPSHLPSLLPSIHPSFGSSPRHIYSFIFSLRIGALDSSV
jgi:hypothetical protein